MNNNTKIISGILLLILSCLVLISMVSFMFSWKEDLSAIAIIFNEGIEIKNITNKDLQEFWYWWIFNNL